jgi:UDP-N-acetyl-D-glucosamine/UDP-N-acetyl-D-galactosamine dehydrogenase
MFKSEKICVIGLGYVGLPLLVELSNHYGVVGFDINQSRINDLRLGIDATQEISFDYLKNKIDNKCISFTKSADDIADCDVYIVTVPTPVDSFNTPNFEPLQLATELVGKALKAGNLVVYESTVYPGATEEICVPILEKVSKLIWRENFNVGYSPERINPGDPVNKLPDIQKVISGDTDSSLLRIAEIYQKIITAGLFHAKSIAVAEAAKVIENVQRDVNIALVNEIAIICSHLKLRTKDVLDTAKTKWNFLPFQPGMVGGHCIGVDPYYLAHKAKSVGYHPELILAGRRLNEHMIKHVSLEICKRLIGKGKSIKGSRIAILGITFKENCPDTRNSKAFELKTELESYHFNVDLFDPYSKEFDEKLTDGCKNLQSFSEQKKYDSIIIFSPHVEIIKLGKEQIMSLLTENGLLYDVKAVFEPCENTLSL